MPTSCGVMGYLPGHRPPPQISFTLNDWIQFDRPGVYKISATYTTYHISPRVANEDPYDYRHSGSWVRVATPTVEVVVAPESPDVAERAATALTYMRSRSPSDRTFPQWANYSQSEAVIPILAQYYEQGWQKFGLVASPHQELVVDTMEKELANPNHSISWDFLQTLAFLSARLRHPALFVRHDEDKWTSQWEADSKVRNAIYLSSLAESLQKLLDAIPQKNPEPQSASLNAVLLVMSRHELPGDTALRKRAATMAAKLWVGMPEPVYLNEYQWKIAGSPALLPLLRKMSDPNPQRMRWIYEVAPQEARNSMQKAIVAGEWTWAAAWTEAIPNTGKVSPALDRSLANGLNRRLEDEEEAAARDFVVLKAGGPSLIPDVRNALLGQDCLGSPRLWSFLLKREGKAAEKRLLDRYHRLESSPRCDTDLQIQQVFAQNLDADWRGYWSPEVEQLIVSQLRDKPSAEDAIEIGAAKLLERFGSPVAEGALWQALTRYHEARSHHLSVSGQTPELEHILISAIENGYHWYPSPEDVQRLKTLCVDQCNELKWIRRADDTQFLIISDDFRTPGRQYGVNGGSFSDDLKNVAEWIRRYPAGTRFSIVMYPGNGTPFPVEAERRYPEFIKTLRDAGMELVGPKGFDQFGRCLLLPPLAN